MEWIFAHDSESTRGAGRGVMGGVGRRLGGVLSILFPDKGIVVMSVDGLDFFFVERFFFLGAGITTVLIDLFDKGSLMDSN